MDRIIASLSDFFTTNPAIAKMIVAAAIALAGLLLFWIFFKLLKRISNRSDKPLLREVHIKLKYPVLAFVVVTIITIIISINRQSDELSGGAVDFISISYIFCTAWLLIKVIQLLRIVVLNRYDVSERDNLKARKVFTQYRILERIIIFVIVIIAISVALMEFDSIRKLGISLFASAGVAGIIIGFAAQRVIGSVLAGFQIALTQPIRLDDAVLVENEWGWIEEINLTYVVIRLWDKRRLILPNSYFIEKPFQNWTRVSADIVGSVFIYTDYHLSLDALRTEFRKILENTELWDGKVQVLQVTDATDRTMEIRALMSAVDSPTAWDLRTHVREKLIQFIQENYPDSLPKTRITVDNPAIHVPQYRKP